ncbi:MAG: hypothetical protein KBT03_12010 [Bacteroidales bacterium]|nr:hypothetical protein [Candidatus Scybalousia scybalohippi]
MTKAEKVKAILDQRGKVQTEIAEVNKNGTELQAIVIGTGEIRATVYPDIWEEVPEEEIADEIEKISLEEVLNLDTKRVKDWEEGKKHCRVVARPVTNDGAVTMPFLDIELYVQIRFNETHSTKVNEQILEQYGITKEQLFVDANNAQVYTVEKLADRIKRLSKECGEEFPDFGFDEVPLLYISNEDGFNGAGAIYNQSAWEMIAHVLGKDIYILPSSIHELIVHPVDKDIELQMLREMVKTINGDMSPEEFLSDSVYIYKKDKRTIEIA